MDKCQILFYTNLYMVQFFFLHIHRVSSKINTETVKSTVNVMCQVRCTAELQGWGV